MNESILRGRVQPDQRSCGPSVLVAARMLLDPGYAARVSGDRGAFGREVLALHRRVTGVRAPSGVLQLPWPRALGTPPWAVAAAMTTYTGPGLAPVDHRVHVARWRGRHELLVRAQEATEAGRPVAIYVGSRWLPRHVVLAVARTETGVRVYDPARGALVAVTTDEFAGARLAFGRWRTPWFVVLPRA